MEAPSLRNIIKKFLILGVVITIAAAQALEKQPSEYLCISRGTCSECIQTPSCAWCFNPDYEGEAKCFQLSSGNHIDENCDEMFIINPDNILRVIQAEALGKPQRNGGGDTWETSSAKSAYTEEDATEREQVQLTPQKLKLELRPKQPFTISVNYRQPADYPLDIYYLMDLSMMDDKEQLSKQVEQLVSAMKNITLDVRFGFGSFVDKPKNLKHPCHNCTAAYGYLHAMSLSTNITQFSDTIKQTNISGNLNAPEGGFDVILQAIVCREQIGWRNGTRKVIVFITDAASDLAGDRKLGGILKPNNGKCHMSSDGFYNASSYQDYPSVEQINVNVKMNQIHIIFAVTNTTIDIYKNIAEKIDGAFVTKLENDSSNIVEFIRAKYEQISTTIEMKHNATKDVSIKFNTNCLNYNNESVNTNKCENIKAGDIVTFKINIEVIKCPENRRDHSQRVLIYPVGFDQKLIVDLKMVCSCDCDKPGDTYYKENSSLCSYQGTYRCGICECNPNAFGRVCECSSEQLAGNTPQMDCINPKDPSWLECSGRGQCVCGRCSCELRSNPDESIFGTYCECDNFSCERRNGKLCSGPDHGRCECGECQCEEEWTGSNCACTKSNATCYTLVGKGGKICSGNGICKCGACVCNLTSEGWWYSGDFCEKPPYYEENSPLCSHQGTYRSGICKCNPNAFGRACEYSLKQLAGNTPQMDCINPKGPPGLECSGKGNCVGGRCSCDLGSNPNEQFYGTYCECDNFSCERRNGKLCGGHGICECGECQCEEEWTGPNCACRKSDAACYAPGGESDQICSGNGICECGACVCNITSEGWYFGDFCEKPPYYEENSPLCSHQGTYRSGICECNPNAFGRACECSSEQLAGNTSQMDCFNPKHPSWLECSGRGQCVCGRCSCELRSNPDESIFGTYCECDTFSCDRHDGKLCGGHGRCECGECQCEEEWIGPNCACRKSNAACYAPGGEGGQICSGNGICECGVCVCNVTSKGRYSGDFCEKCPYYEENSPLCSYQGTYSCGACECNPNAFGLVCESSSEQLVANTSQMDCINPKGPSGLECSGRGQCIRGLCSCELRYNPYESIFGTYCECDNFSCDRHDGKLCGGHGRCECGECQCEEEWTGPNCVCRKSNATCYAPGGEYGKICSGNGICECGACVCNDTSEMQYSGKFCEKCPTCSDRCNELKDCVQCLVYETGPLNVTDCVKCPFVPIVEWELRVDEEFGDKLCVYLDEDVCRFAFIYNYDEHYNLRVRALSKRKCFRFP